MNIAHFAQQGHATITGVVSQAQCDELTQHVAQLDIARAGSRNLLALPWCRQLLATLRSHGAIHAILPNDAVAVQCTQFEKTVRKNWAVSLHQDLSIPVRSRVDTSECSGWALKEGVHFVQPPAAVLAGLLAVRVHLDACPSEAGPLRVVPGSHRLGRVAGEEAAALRVRHGEAECVAARGDVLIMRPLLLHASSRVAGEGASVRRVLHFLFGPPQLPFGLHWHLAV